MSDFKVGDRVVGSYGGKGTVVKDMNEELYMVKFDEREKEECMKEHKLTKLVKKPVVFNVGDRVIDDKNYKGKIIDILDGCAMVCRDKDFLMKIYPYDVADLKKLRKKKAEFKVGDRVLTAFGKGSIDSFHYRNKDLAIVKLDSACITSNLIETRCLTKLRKKKIEFKVGDRVIDKYGNKGEIREDTYISKFFDGIVVKVFYDYGFPGLPNTSDLKKLIKKPKAVPEFKVGDYVECSTFGRAIISRIGPEEATYCLVIANSGEECLTELSGLKKVVKPEPKIDWSKPVRRKEMGTEESVRVISTNMRDERYPILVLFTNKDGKDSYGEYTKDGKCKANESRDELFLKNVPESELPKQEKKFDPFKPCRTKHGKKFVPEYISLNDISHPVLRGKMEGDVFVRGWDMMSGKYSYGSYRMEDYDLINTEE